VAENLKVHPLPMSRSTEILDLINRIQPHIPWSSEYLMWQFQDHPGGPAKIWGIEDEGRIVSIYAAVTQTLWMNGGLFKACMVQDVMTDPHYRGRGFLHQLAQTNIDWMKTSNVVGYTFPNDLSAKSFERVGWQALMSVPWIRKKLKQDASHLKSKLSLERQEVSTPTMEEIFTRSALPTGVHRSRAYLNWRYSKPGQTYEFFSLSNDAYIVLKKYKDENQTSILHLLDLCIREEAKNLLKDILSWVENYAIESSAELLTAWCSASHPYHGGFQESGWNFEPHATRKIYTGNTNSKEWHFTQGDSDVY